MFPFAYLSIILLDNTQTKTVSFRNRPAIIPNKCPSKQKTNTSQSDRIQKCDVFVSSLLVSGPDFNLDPIGERNSLSLKARAS